MNDHKEKLSDITNFLPITNRLGSAGQPFPEQFPLLKEAGYKMVINLALPTSTNAIPHEGELVTDLRMTYVHIPVQWEHPTLDDFHQFTQVMKAFQDRKVFVHCALNMRVSSFLYLYRVLYEGIPPETAAQSLHSIWQPNEVWLKFIADVLGKTQ